MPKAKSCERSEQPFRAWEDVTIPPLEFEILYKEKILTGIKDIEDAKHLRNMFKEILSEEKFKKCQIVIGEELENLKMK